MEWLPIESAPRDGTPFTALNHDREVWVAKYDPRGRLYFRSHGWRDSYRYTTRQIDGEEWRKYDRKWEDDNSGWTDHWSLWTKGYEFAPTHWMPLPPPPEKSL